MGFPSVGLNERVKLRFLRETTGDGARDRARRWAVLLSIAFSVTFSFLCSRWPGSDGRTAAVLDAVGLLALCNYAYRRGDRELGRLLAAAGAFGLAELPADFLCVRCTGTLDYAVARSAMVWESPWWMPFSWALVAVQVGTLGDAAIRRFDFVRGALLTGLTGALLIPFYEEMAWGANWWRYRNCLLIGHTPVYIVFAEGIIGAGLALLGYLAMRVCTAWSAVTLGACAGLVTLLGGVVGWGAVEFICRGVRPLWP